MRAIAACALVSTGCLSFWTMKDKPQVRSDPPCQRSYTVVAVDAALAGAAATLSIITLANLTNADGCVDPCLDNLSDGNQTLGVVAFGLLTAAQIGSAIYGYRSVGECREAPPQDTLPDRIPTELPVLEVRRGPLVEAVPAHDPEARDLTVEAHARAVVGDCTYTRERAATVRERDSGYYVRVFLADPALVRCLRATGSTVP